MIVEQIEPTVKQDPGSNTPFLDVFKAAHDGFVDDCRRGEERSLIERRQNCTALITKMFPDLPVFNSLDFIGDRLILDGIRFFAVKDYETISRYCLHVEFLCPNCGKTDSRCVYEPYSVISNLRSMEDAHDCVTPSHPPTPTTEERLLCALRDLIEAVR